MAANNMSDGQISSLIFGEKRMVKIAPRQLK